MKKTITIEYNGLQTSIKFNDELTPLEVLGLLRYHEKNLFAGLLKHNEEKNEKKEPELSHSGYQLADQRRGRRTVGHHR